MTTRRVTRSMTQSMGLQIAPEANAKNGWLLLYIKYNLVEISKQQLSSVLITTLLRMLNS